MTDGEHRSRGEASRSATGGARQPARHPWARAAAAGLLASIALAPVDSLLDRFVSREHERRARRLRRGSPHELAGPRAARRLSGRRLSSREERLARTAFGAVYGVGWGLAYGLVRRRFPAAARYGGLPFAVPFFALCDGVIAPLLNLTPSIHRLPWQIAAKELANHAAWTALAESVHRRSAPARPPTLR